MKELAGSATGTVQAGADRCYEFLSDVESYPKWATDTVREVVVKERDDGGTPTVADVALVFAFGPLKFDKFVPMNVVLEPESLVWLHRVADDEHDPEQFQVKWSLNSVAETATELTLQLSANLDLPPFLPGLSMIADDVARGLMHAAANSVEAGAA